MAEKTSEKTACMATYSTPVAQAAGNSARREILPASKIRMVSHQKPVAQTRPAAASRAGPLAPHVFGQRPGIGLLAPLRGPVGPPDARPAGPGRAGRPCPRPLARPVGGLARRRLIWC